MKKYFKKFLIASVLTLSPTLILSSCGGNDTEDPMSETFTIKSTYNSERGTVTLDKTEGVVGEKVNATISPKEGYRVTEIKFNKETRQAATSLELIPVKGENTLEVTFASSISVEKKLIISGDYKTEYKVGEALSFEGLEVKMVTTTDGVSDEGVTYTDYKTGCEEGYVFKEDDISVDGETFDVSIYSDDETITSATLELTVVPALVEEVGITPAQFLRKMKETERYTVESAEIKGVYIPNANYWTAIDERYESYGFAQDGESIIVYKILDDRYVESTRYSQVSEANKYNGMYDQKFEDYLVDREDIYHNRGIGFISDEEIANYEAKLKPSKNNPNVFNIAIADDAKSVFARDLVQLTFNGSLALNDFGLRVTMGYQAAVRLTMLSKTSMKIEIINGTSVRYWPISTVITLDETADIPEIKPFLEHQEAIDPELEKAKKSFEYLRAGNFTTATGNTFTKDYSYNKETNTATFTADNDFTYNENQYTAGNYKVEFNKDNTVKALTSIEVGGFNDILSNSLLHKDEMYLTYFDKEENKLTLTLYANYDSEEYLISIPNLYCSLFGIDKNTTEEDCNWRNIKFVVHFTDKECTIVDYINVIFGRESGNKEIQLTNFGTSKVAHVDTFINSLK